MTESNLTPSFVSRRQRRKRKRILKFFGVITLLGITGLLFVSQFNKTELINPLIGMHRKADLKTVLNDALSGAEGTYGVVVKNLKNGQSYSINEHKTFEVGSLYKLWIMATVYKRIEEGKLSGDDVLTEDIENLNNIFNISSDSAELTEGTISLSVHDALSQMITISHNYAALLLTEAVKLSTVSNFLKDYGLSESLVGTNGNSPRSTPSDIALFFEKLYKGELINQQYSQEMIDLLKNQILNEGLPKYIPNIPLASGEQSPKPQSGIIAHKTGDIGWSKHDGGIVFTDKGDYIIVVMSESDYPPGAQERIALISKAVFDYFRAN